MDNAERIAKTIVYPDGRSEEAEAVVISEHELTIIVNEMPVCRLICTKSNLKELVYGRLLTDGIIACADDIRSVHFCESENRARVFTAGDVFLEEKPGTEPSCCTGNRVFASKKGDKILKEIPRSSYRPEWVFGMAEEFGKDTRLHMATGGCHNCILAKNGKTLFVCEDIGRHNAVDKAVGYAVINHIPLNECMLFTSGRVPVDMTEKVIAAGIPVLVSKSVPSYESVQMAKKYGLTLINRAWPDKYEIFH